MSSTSNETSRSKAVATLQQALGLIGTGACLWVLLIGPAWLLAGIDGVVGLTLAAFVCILPGCVAAVAKVVFAPSPNVFFLLSTFLRFGFVLVTALVAKAERPELGIRQFYVWLIVFYLQALAVETWLMLRRAA